MMSTVTSLSLIALQNALFVAVATFAVVAVIRAFRLRSTALHQWLWMIALLPGACLIDFAIRLPISLPTPLTSKMDLARSVSLQLIQGPSSRSSMSERNSRTGSHRGSFERKHQEGSNNARSSSFAQSGSISTERPVEGIEPGQISPEQKYQLVMQSAPFRTTPKPENNNDFYEAIGTALPAETSGAHSSGGGFLSGAPGHFEQGSHSRVVSVMGQDDRAKSLWSAVPPISFRTLFGCLWVVGVVVLAMRWGLQWVLLQIELREASSAPGEWQREWRRVLAERRLDRPIRLLRHSNLGPFLTVTPLGAVVVVPDDYWEELTESERKAVLRHELRHYERGDLWLSVVADLLLIPQWFNPLAWHARRRLDECIELNCDEQSLKREEERAAFAKALLKLVEFPSFRWSGVKAAKNSSIGLRIRKLLLPSAKRDSTWLQLVAVTCTVMVASLVLIRFEAAASSTLSPSADELADAGEVSSEALLETAAATDGESDLDSFVTRLDLKNDSTGKLKDLAAALQKESGKLALRERATSFEEQLRQQAESEPIPRILRNYFDQKDGRFVLKANQQSHVEQFAKECQEFESDTASIDGLLKSIANRLEGSDETTQLVKRFLMDPIAATVLYSDWVRAEVRPDYKAVIEQLSDYFVVNREGQLIPRPGSDGDSREILRQLERVHQLSARFQRDLAEWASDLSQKHPLSAKIREAMNHPSFAIYQALDHAEDDYAMDQVIEEYFEYIEYMFEDRADGLVPNEDREAEWNERLQEIQTMRTVGGRLKPVLAQVAANLEAIDDLGKRWQRVLPTELFSSWLASEMNITSSDPKQNAEDYLMQFFSETAEGKLSINTDRKDEFEGRIRDWLRDGRSLRRRGSEIVAFADQLADPKLASAYKSLAGKSLLLRLIRSELAREYFDGLGAWIEEHFEETDDGYLLKEGHEWEVDNFLTRVADIEKETESNDF